MSKKMDLMEYLKERVNNRFMEYLQGRQKIRTEHRKAKDAITILVKTNPQYNSLDRYTKTLTDNLLNRISELTEKGELI